MLIPSDISMSRIANSCRRATYRSLTLAITRRIIDSNIIMSTRFILRSKQRHPFTFFSSATAGRQPLNASNHAFRFRRSQSSTTIDAGRAATSLSYLRRLWTSVAGIKTVHFWAPIMKWGVVISGLSDLVRPAGKLSLTQNFALLITGAIWTRWCFIIKPRNIL